VRRIEKGDTQPRPLPGLKEDSIGSMQSMESMQSAASMKFMQSADYASRVSEETASGTRIQEDMPLQEIRP